MSKLLTRKVIDNIVNVSPLQIKNIRNDEWSVFVESYHNCLEKASQIAWIFEQAGSFGFLSDPDRLDEVVQDVFSFLEKETDISIIGDILNSILTSFWGITVFSPLFIMLNLFKSKVNKFLRNYYIEESRMAFKPFLDNINVMLQVSTIMQS